MSQCTQHSCLTLVVASLTIIRKPQAWTQAFSDIIPAKTVTKPSTCLLVEIIASAPLLYNDCLLPDLGLFLLYLGSSLSCKSPGFPSCSLQAILLLSIIWGTGVGLSNPDVQVLGQANEIRIIWGGGQVSVVCRSPSDSHTKQSSGVPGLSIPKRPMSSLLLEWLQDVIADLQKWGS